MIQTLADVPLLRSTVLLSVSALVVAMLLRTIRPRSPIVHRIAWSVVLLQGLLIVPVLSFNIGLIEPADDDAVSASIRPPAHDESIRPLEEPFPTTRELIVPETGSEVVATVDASEPDETAGSTSTPDGDARRGAFRH